MILPFEIFKVDGNHKKPERLGATESIAKALELAQRKGVGNYMLHARQTGLMSMYVVNSQGVVEPTV